MNRPQRCPQSPRAPPPSVGQQPARTFYQRPQDLLRDPAGRTGEELEGRFGRPPEGPPACGTASSAGLRLDASVAGVGVSIGDEGNLISPGEVHYPHVGETTVGVATAEYDLLSSQYPIRLPVMRG